MLPNNEQTAVMTIEVGMTQQPESYTSVRRSVTLPVFVKPGDDITAIAKSKMAEAVKIVEDSIDDDFERGHGASAKYSDEPRYNYIRWPEKSIAVIIPANNEPPRGWSKLQLVEKNHRLAHLKKNLSRYGTILDCSQDFTALQVYPEICHGLLTWQPKHKIIILTAFEKDPPDSFKKQYFTNDWGGGWGRDGKIDFYENLIEWAKEKAEKQDSELYICWDGDLSLIPPPAPPAPPEPDEDDEDEDEDDEDEDEDDEDEDDEDEDEIPL
jgi:hypothetical protein